MPRHARGLPFLGAMLTTVWLTAAAVGSAQAPSDDSLATRLEAERQSPIAALTEGVPKPRSLESWGAAPLDPDAARASAAEILQAVSSALPSESRHTRPDQATVERAKRLAEQAAADREKGSLGEASRLYRESLRLNPASAKHWSEFAAVLEQQSNPIGAKSAYAEAIALGDRSFQTMLHYGLLAAEFREDRAALAALLTAASFRDENTDAAGFVLSAALADTLARNEYLQAAVDHYTRLAALPASYNEPTSYRDRLNEVYRNRRESMWRGAEISHSIGDWQSLDRFIASAVSLPGPKHPDEAAIRCYTLLRTGRPAMAATMLISTLGGDTDARETVDLLGYVAEHTDLGAEMDAALSDHADSLTREQRLLARQSLVLARAAIASPDAASEPILLDHLRTHPTDRAVWLEFLSTAPESAVAALLDIHPCLEPEVTAAALGLHGPTDVDGTSAFGLRSTLRRGDFAQALTAYLDTQSLPTDESPRPEIEYQLLSLGVEVLVDSYRGTEADRLLDAATRQASSVSERLAVARALIMRHRHRDALAILEHEALVDSAPPVLVRSIAARAKLGLGDEPAALAIVRRALDEDPAEYDATVLLIDLGKIQEAAQRLRSIPAADAQLRLVRAINAIEREQFDLADRLLREAWNSPLQPDAAANHLVMLLEKNGAVDAADSWLEEQVEQYPDRMDLVVLRSSLLRADRQPEEALDLVLNARMIRQGSPVLSLELEALLREDFDASDRWLSQARSRLVNAPSTFATFMDRANVELAADKVEQAISLAELAADLAPSPSPTEKRSLNELLDAISNAIITQPRVQRNAIEGFARVFDRLESPSVDAWKGRISVASIDRDTDEDGMIRLATQAADSLPEFGEEAFIHAAQAVMVAARTGQSLLDDEGAEQAASTIYAAATRRLDPYPSRVLGAWIEFSQQIQDPFVLGEAIRSLGETGGPQDRRLREAVMFLVHRGTQGAIRDPNIELLTESTFYLASQLTINDQFDTAQSLYEEALRMMPDHPELNNDYGFHLLDRHEQVDRAIRMIEVAYAQNPGSSHIVDSMGWVRYKQGQFADELQPEAGGMRAGAISLLRQAKTLSVQEDPSGLNACFTTDHLGDALWANGNTEEAVQQWTEAAELAERASKGIRGLPLPLSVELELQDLKTQAIEKVRAAGEDRNPAIAPILD